MTAKEKLAKANELLAPIKNLNLSQQDQALVLLCEAVNELSEDKKSDAPAQPS